MSQIFKKHWIIFRKLDITVSIHINLYPDKIARRWVKDQLIDQDLTKDRPYLIIEEDEKTLLIFTLTKHGEEKDKENKKDEEGKPSFGRFGSIKCPCLDLDSYVILGTKIFITQEFIKKFRLDLETQNNKIKHQCLSNSHFFELGEALEAYWNKANRKLTIIKLGVDSEPKERKKIKRKSTSLFLSDTSEDT